MADFTQAAAEVAAALRALVNAMRDYDAARMGLSSRPEAQTAANIYDRLRDLRRLVQAPLHDAGRPDGRGVSLESTEWPPGMEALKEAVLTLNDIPPLSWESEVFSLRIPGSTERLVAGSLPRFAGVLGTLDSLLTESGKIEAAAIRAGMPPEVKTAREKPGRKETPIEVLIERVKYANAYGVAAACDQYNRSPSAISKWKERLKAANINPDELN